MECLRPYIKEIKDGMAIMPAKAANAVYYIYLNLIFLFC
jgi:hypothetical protein